MPYYYTTPATVGKLLNVTLTGDQTYLLDQVIIGAAEAWIERRRGQSWPTTAIVDQAYYGVAGPHLYLKTAPIVSVQSVKARAGMGATETTLTVNTEYEVRDLATGHLYIPAQGGSAAGDIITAGGADGGGGLPYDRFRVSYTPATSVPDDIALAATLLAAHWLRPTMDGTLPGIQSYSVGSELSVTYGTELLKAGVPAEVLRLVPRRLGFA